MTGLTLQPSLEASLTVTRVVFFFSANVRLIELSVRCRSSRFSAMSTATWDEPPSIMCSDLHVGDTTHELEDAILIDEEDEHYSTGYSEFCDDDTIMLASDTIGDEVDSSPTCSSPATTLGKRKSAADDSGLSYSYASHKRHSTSSDSAGSSSEPYIIAHNTSIQHAMDFRKLPWGVQWEIARLISRGHCTWEDISIPYLDRLKKEGSCDTSTVLNNPIAPYIEDLFRWRKESFGHQRTSKEVQATSPWPELDREDLAFSKEDGHTQGPASPGSTQELRAWYGGKVSFRMRLDMDEKNGHLQFLLDHPILGPSSRFTRCYGSSWLIRVKPSMVVLSRPDKVKELKKLLLRPLILNGQVFRFFYAKSLKKDISVFLMATNEHYDGSITLQHNSSNGQRGYNSFLGFFAKHNNLQENLHQTITKWAARIALGLSNSVPGLMLDNSQIRGEIDIVSSSCPSGIKHPSEMDMTDGCGLINLHAIHMLHERLGLWKEFPVAIQCRLAGAKGLLLLHPGKKENSWEYPCVWLRPSQIKIQPTLGYMKHPAHRTIDTLKASYMQSSVKISREITINLSENGVSTNIFVDLFIQSLKDITSSLLNWDGPDAMAQLWAIVFKESNTMSDRIARKSSWTAKASGIKPYTDQDDANDDDELNNDDSPHSMAWWGDEISGCPSSIEETVLAFLDSGFHPSTNTILAAKLHEVAKTAVKTSVLKFRTKVPMSCRALIVPDVLGVLKEGEIHIKSSQRCLLRIDGQKSDRITGDVLVTRSPCKLPTDVQKVKAVFKSELDDYVNVIMFSIKGPRSLASMLGTGDYDGDMVICIWQPSIVEQFCNADPKFMDPPICLQDHFNTKNETVTEFLQRIPPTSPTDTQICEAQEVFMSPLLDVHAVGIYSTMHENAMYSLGYSHPTTILLAWIFCTVLDGAKTGKTLLQERYSQDRNNETYGIRYTPPWKDIDRDHNTAPGQPSSIRLSRPSSLRPFVMDILCEETQRVKDDCLRQIEERFNSLPKVKDRDLIRPWQVAEEHTKEMLTSPEPNVRIIGEAHKSAMAAIEAHVVRVHDLSLKLMNKNVGGARASTGIVGVGSPGTSRAGARHGKSSTSGKRAGGPDFTHWSIELRQDLLRRVSREFVGGPPAKETFVFSQEEVAKLRASYAYLYDWTRHGGGGSRFPWNVAFDELGEIKLRANKDFKPISRDFYEKMSMR